MVQLQHSAFREVDAAHLMLQTYTLFTFSTQLTVNEMNSQTAVNNELNTDSS